MEDNIAINPEICLCSCSDVSDVSLDLRFDANAWGIPEAAINSLDDDFDSLCRRYSPLLVTKTRDTSSYGKAYISGLLRNEKSQRTFKGIANTTGVPEQNLHHFMSNSPWQTTPVISQILKDIVTLCLDDPIEECALILDESGDQKASNKTIGASRQYLGRLGKVDLCQMGVYLAYSSPSVTQLISGELFLPEKWFTHDYEQQRKLLKLPDERTFQTKSQLGLLQIRRLKENGTLPFSFVACDASYGKEPDFLAGLRKLDLVYMADIPVNRRVYRKKPQMGIPNRKSNKGRQPTRRRSLDVPLQRVDKIARALPDENWNRLRIRHTERGYLDADFAALRVCTQTDGEPEIEQWLVLRRELSGRKRLSAALCNAPPETSLVRLARMKCARFWVEHSIQNSKSEIGMDELCAQNYPAWQHHLTLTLLALYFIEEVRNKWQQQYPIDPNLLHSFSVEVLPRLSVSNIRTLLRARFPLIPDTVEQAQRKVVERLVNRTSSRRSYLKKQRPP
jgi:SRSO17 transposase